MIAKTPARRHFWQSLQTTTYAPSPATVLLAAIFLILAGLIAVERHEAAAATRAVTIKDLAFTPDKVTADVGDTVTWTNRETDGTDHRVSFDGGPESADIDPGQSYSRTFNSKGTFHYICSLHSYMEGTVTVGGGGPGGPTPKPSPSASRSPSPSPSPTPLLPALPTPPAVPGLPPGGDGEARDLGDGTQLAPYTVEDGVKVFRLRMAKKQWEVTKGKFREAWTFNGLVPGPVLRVNERDQVRIIVQNDLPEMTAVHWHGMELPNDQDGVPGITQQPIRPGQSKTYAWQALVSGTHWYHSHMDGAQIGRGLYGSLEVVPLAGDVVADRDYRLMISDGALGMVLNGRSYPFTKTLAARVGERVRIRLIGTGPELLHPFHLHGQPFELVAQDGMPLPVPQQMDTLTVAPGQTFDIVVTPRRPGKWLVHCHIFSHSETKHGMQGLVTMLDVAPGLQPQARP